MNPGLLDLNWYKQCQFQLKEMAEDPDQCLLIIDILDNDPELREELSALYVKAIRTRELSWKE